MECPLDDSELGLDAGEYVDAAAFAGYACCKITEYGKSSLADNALRSLQ